MYSLKQKNYNKGKITRAENDRMTMKKKEAGNKAWGFILTLSRGWLVSCEGLVRA